MNKYKFTVFTPTYNRADTLSRVFESLIRQSFQEFEWLIVDDGSSDNTKDLVSEWMRNAQFPVRYIYQENSGKLSAINNGVQNAQGEFFLIADSDDEFVSDALSEMYKAWCAIECKEQFCGVVGLCADADTGEVVGDRFPEDIFDVNALDMEYKYCIKGEKWGFTRTEILKKFPFPLEEGEKFIPEGIVWLKIARNYKTRFINKVLRIYYQNEGGALSANLLKYPRGLLKWYIFNVNDNFDYLVLNKRDMLISFINMSRMALHSHTSIISVFITLNSLLKKTLFLVLIPFGFFFGLRDRMKGRI